MIRKGEQVQIEFKDCTFQLDFQPPVPDGLLDYVRWLVNRAEEQDKEGLLHDQSDVIQKMHDQNQELATRLDRAVKALEDRIKRYGELSVTYNRVMYAAVRVLRGQGFDVGVGDPHEKIVEALEAFADSGKTAQAKS